MPSVRSRTVLVTDAMAALGVDSADARLGDLLVTVDETGVRTPDGVLAGSNLTLDRAVRNLVEFTGLLGGGGGLAPSPSTLPRCWVSPIVV